MKRTLSSLTRLTVTALFLACLGSAFALDPTCFDPSDPDCAPSGGGGGGGGGLEGVVGGVAGDLFGQGAGEFIGEYGDDIYNGFQKFLGEGGFSVKNILDIGCSTATNAANSANGGNNGNNGSGVSRSICEAKQAYGIIDEVTTNWSDYLTVWGADTVTGFVASELGLGSLMSDADLTLYSDQITEAILGYNPNNYDPNDPNDPNNPNNPNYDPSKRTVAPQARLAELSGGKLATAVLEATGLALEKQADGRKDTPENSAERRYWDAIQANPNLGNIDRQNQLEILENTGTEAQGIENSLRSGQIGIISGDKTKVLEEVGENLEAYSEVRFKQFDSAVSTRAVQQYNSQAIVDAITNQNVSFQQNSAQLSLSAQQEAVATQQFSALTKLQVNELNQKARGRSAALQSAINRNIEGVESISLGVESVGASFTQLPASSGTVGASAFK